MTNQSDPTPYDPQKPGNLITAEGYNQMQVDTRKEIAANAAAASKAIDDLGNQLKNVDAQKFGGKTPNDWTDTLDKRYVRIDSVEAAGQYRRYFKQADELVNTGSGDEVEAVVIEHKLCRYPIVEVFELMPLFDTQPKIKGYPDNTDQWPFVWDRTKFLLFYASNRDPVAEMLSTEAGERIYWGDPLSLILDQLKVTPALTQKLDDLVNDVWGKMFNPQEEDDDFTGDTYGQSLYFQKWMDGDKSVDDMVKGGQWDDLKLAARPKLISPTFGRLNSDGNTEIETVQIFHLSQNAIEIRVPRKMEMMVILRT